MSAFDALLTDQVAAVILRRFGLGAEGVQRVRLHTIARLADAARRVPRDNPRILAEFAARGLPAPAWRLDNDDDAVEFTLALREFARPGMSCTLLPCSGPASPPKMLARSRHWSTCS